jgi:hypothetical protein
VLLRSWLARFARFARLSGLTVFPRLACLTRLTGFLRLAGLEGGSLGLERRVLWFSV